MNTTDPRAENKRLYALDVAAVGPEEAPKRWQGRLKGAKNWQQLILPNPYWNEVNEFRRDPNAPPLPSMDWHSAPSGAKYRAQGSKCPIWCTYVPVYVEVGESRPNKEWFDLTRAEYETQNSIGENVMPEDPKRLVQRLIDEIYRLAETYGDRSCDYDVNKIIRDARAYVSNHKFDMNDEILTGSALHRALADAMDDGGEWWEQFECRDTSRSFRRILPGELFQLLDSGCDIRRKPTTYTVTLESGERVDVPKPMTKAPRPGTEAYVAFRPVVDPIKWKENNEVDREWLAQGRCYASRKDKEQAERALTQILTGGEA